MVRVFNAMVRGFNAMVLDLNAMMLVENDMPELSVMKRPRSQYEKRFIHYFQIENYLSYSIFLAGVIICELAHSTFSLCRENRVDNGRSF